VPFAVAREPHARKRNRLVEELQAVARACVAPGSNRSLARAQAVGPQ
jgi:hypothetical protein